MELVRWIPMFYTIHKLGKMVMEALQRFIANKDDKDRVSKSSPGYPNRCTHTYIVVSMFPELSGTNCNGYACRMCILKCKTGETIKCLDTSLEHTNVNCSREKNTDKFIFLPAISSNIAPCIHSSFRWKDHTHPNKPKLVKKQETKKM